MANFSSDEELDEIIANFSSDDELRPDKLFHSQSEILNSATRMLFTKPSCIERMQTHLDSIVL